MDIAPYLETDRLVLGPTRLRDVVFFWRLAGNPDVRQFLGGPVPWRHRLFKFHRCLRGHPKAGIWVVRRRGHSAAIGLVALRPHIDGADYEVSYAFKPASWGQGFAREAAARVVEHAIHDLALRKVVAETQSTNAASCRLLATLGFAEEIRVARFGAEQVIFGICKQRQAAVRRLAVLTGRYMRSSTG